MMCATRAQFSGSVSRTQSSFVKVKLVSGELQVSSNQGFKAEQFFELFALRLAALVAPDDGAAHGFILRIQQHGPVHLSREADARNILRA